MRRMSLVDQLEQQLVARLRELEPAVAEHREIERALAALRRGRDGAASAGGRARGGGGPSRSERALALIARRPGVTVGELAEELGIGPTYLYKLLPALEREGRVRKEGAGYHPVEQTAPERRADDRQRRATGATRPDATGTRASGDAPAPGTHKTGPSTARSPSRRKRRSSAG
jgi:transposase-like protein